MVPDSPPTRLWTAREETGFGPVRTGQTWPELHGMTPAEVRTWLEDNGYTWVTVSTDLADDDTVCKVVVGGGNQCGCIDRTTGAFVVLVGAGTETVLASTELGSPEFPGTVTTGACWGGVAHHLTGGSGSGTSDFPATAGTTVFARLEFRDETGNDSWENNTNYDYEGYIRFSKAGGGLPVVEYLIVKQLYHNTGCILVQHQRNVVVPAGYDRVQIRLASRLGGYQWRGWIGTLTCS